MEYVVYCIYVCVGQSHTSVGIYTILRLSLSDRAHGTVSQELYTWGKGCCMYLVLLLLLELRLRLLFGIPVLGMVVGYCGCGFGYLVGDRFLGLVRLCMVVWRG